MTRGEATAGWPARDRGPPDLSPRSAPLYGVDPDLCEAFRAEWNEEPPQRPATEADLWGFVHYCLRSSDFAESEPIDVPRADDDDNDTWFECPPPTAADLAEAYGYDLPLCETYLAFCLDCPHPVEPTEQGLHELAHDFAHDYLQAAKEPPGGRAEACGRGRPPVLRRAHPIPHPSTRAPIAHRID
jgi:hypothetical protein